MKARKQHRKTSVNQNTLDLTTEEDYGEVEGISVADNEEDMVKFLTKEGY